MAGVYAIIDDADGKANSKMYTCATDLFDNGVGVQDTVEHCMGVVSDLFQTSSDVLDTYLGTW